MQVKQQDDWKITAYFESPSAMQALLYKWLCDNVHNVLEPFGIVHRSEKHRRLIQERHYCDDILPVKKLGSL